MPIIQMPPWLFNAKFGGVPKKQLDATTFIKKSQLSQYLNQSPLRVSEVPSSEIQCLGPSAWLMAPSTVWWPQAPNKRKEISSWNSTRPQSPRKWLETASAVHNHLNTIINSITCMSNSMSVSSSWAVDDQATPDRLPASHKENFLPPTKLA